MTEQFRGEIDWDVIESNWQLEPELRQKIPRRVSLRGEKVGCGGRIFGCFIGGMLVFMFAVGLMMSVWAGLALLILPFGAPTEGRVTRHEMTVSSGRRKGTQSFFLYFRFARKGRNYVGEWPVSRRIYVETLDGAAVKVRYFPLAPGLRPIIEEGASPWFHVWGLGPLGLLMLGVSGVVLTGFFVPKSGKSLVRRGVAAPAIIVSRTFADAGKSAAITYLFRAQNRTWQKTRRLNRVQNAPFDVGTILTVLHHPRWPQRALIYRFCDFIASD